MVSERLYFRCRCCHLIYLDARHRLQAAEEKAIYDLHQNNPEDSDYRQFMSSLFVPMRQKIDGAGCGLDFGCGNGSALSAMFTESGYQMSQYDPFYFPDTGILKKQYDFITATEVLEHLYQPGEVLFQLRSMLKARAVLGLMTLLYSAAIDFSQWHYARDPTHVCFYSVATFEWVAEHYGATVDIIGDRVILLEFS